jgi:chromosome segregation ATPase
VGIKTPQGRKQNDMKDKSAARITKKLDEHDKTITEQAARIQELENLFADAKNIIEEKNAKILELKRNKGIEELEKALKNMVDAYNTCKCGCDPDETWQAARALLGGE